MKEVFTFIFEVIIGVGSVLILVNAGIFIGKNYGTFEAFIL